ncbi:Lysyl-tRNA synthetase (class II) [Clostridiaceae bacterium JG1575]|nr:Lysyl-tRNA synthetase (class II) [Clostridiaceae bacterium JG1575]
MANEELKDLDLKELEAHLSEQEGLRRDKLSALQKEGKDPFQVYKVQRTHTSQGIRDHYEELQETTVTIAGRLMSKRGQGKVIFADLYDRDGKIQLFVKLDQVGEEALKFFKTLDLGDWLSVTGIPFTTKTGELSVKVSGYELISKSVKPLPDKWHGLKDPDLRYRRREVDIIANPDVKDTFIKRSRILSGIRRYLDQRGYLEVETPILSPIAGGAAARPFITHHNTLDIDMYLRIATELYLKRCIVAGFEKVYDMGKNFRNEGIDYKHNPEFTMIELYEAFADYHDMMDLVEDLISSVALEVTGSMVIDYQGTQIDLTPPWRRVSMQELVKEHAGVDFSLLSSDEEAHKLIAEHHLEGELKKNLKEYTKGEILNLMFEKYAEKKLIQPTLVMDYPVEISPLTKGKRGNPELTERFEGFINASEICNAYSELNDPIVQRQRFEQQSRERDLGDDEAYVIDEDFMSALETGMPPTGGLGIGVDRIIMFLTDAASIRDVILFPTMKALPTDK